MQTEAQIKQSIFDWLKRESGLTTIIANQKDPRPPRPYASLDFLGGGTKLGGQDQQSITDTFTVASDGMRSAVASINIFGENANDRLAKIRDSLDRADVIEEFEVAQVGFIDESSIRDLTALQETMYEERAQLDLTIVYAVGSEANVGTIESVKADGNINGHDSLVTFP